MRIFVITLLIFNLSGLTLLAAGPTKYRSWTSAESGQTFSARALFLTNGVVTFQKRNGSKVSIPLEKFSKENQEFINEHFAKGDKPKKDAVKPADKPDAAKKDKKEAVEEKDEDKGKKKFPVEQGGVSDAIEASPAAKYYLYIPDLLTPDTKNVPMLLYINGGGGKDKDLDDYIDFAESFGWILAVSINNKKGLKNLENLSIAEDCTRHIQRTLPIDKRRTYLAGDRDGAALAIMFSERIKAHGVLAINGYTDDEWSPNADHYYFLSGARSHMRYATAASHKKFSRKTPYILYEGTSKIPDEDYLFDALLWMQMNYLGPAKTRLKEEAERFETEVMERIEENVDSDNQRAYLYALMLRDNYALGGEAMKKLEPIIKKLEEDKDNKLYIQGRAEFAKIAKRYLRGEGKTYKKGYTDAKLASACKKLAKKYDNIPYITEVLEALQLATD